jgi:hypothetical protein
MFGTADQRLRLVNDRIDRLHREAAEARLADQAPRRHRLSLRQRTAHRLIQLGERLAAEPALTPRPVPMRAGRAPRTEWSDLGT